MSQEIVEKLMDAVGNGDVNVFVKRRCFDSLHDYSTITSIYTDDSGDVIIEIEGWLLMDVDDDYENYIEQSIDARREELAAKSHPSFTVTCNNCRSKGVVVVSSMGYSPESGGWGSVDLKCLRCGKQEEIYS